MRLLYDKIMIMKNYDNIIIGGGASGLMCAAHAKGKTLIIERNKKFGNKILASGGGCCNFSNLNISSDNYLSHNPHFVKSALSEFGVNDFLTILKEHNIKWEEREFGQFFAFSSQDILDMLIKEASKPNVDFLCGREVTQVNKNEDVFEVTASGERYFSRNIIVSSGGISFAKLGVSSKGMDIAEGFGLDVYPLKPALCGLNYKKNYHSEFTALSGISLKVNISQGKRSFTNQLLFTHKGLSGPAALQMSVYFDENKTVKVDFLPGIDAEDIVNSFKKTNEKPVKIFQEFLPKNMLKVLFDNHDYGLANANKKQLADMVKILKEFEFHCFLSSFDTAEVMSGGINTNHISSQNMECKEIPGLFFTGEVLDVTGQLGGYNLHWAWASGYACALKGNL